MDLGNMTPDGCIKKILISRNHESWKRIRITNNKTYKKK